MPLIASAPPHPFQVPPGAPRRKTASVVFRCRGVFRIDIERCPQCGGRVRVIACIDSPEVIDTILSHLAAREADTARGMHPARAPPRKGYPGPWQTHTKRMLRHKTLIQGFRLAFGFAGIYDEDEAGRIIDAQYAHVEQLPVDDPARRLARRLAAPKADSTSAPEPTVVAPLAVDEPQESDQPVTDSAAPTANKVAATRHGLQELLLRGDGRFVNERGKHVPSAEVLEDIHVARKRLAQLHDALLNEPRRKSPAPK